MQHISWEDAPERCYVIGPYLPPIARVSNRLSSELVSLLMVRSGSDNASGLHPSFPRYEFAA